MQKNRELIKTEYHAKHGEEIKFTDIAKEAGARCARRSRGVPWRCPSPPPWRCPSPPPWRCPSPPPWPPAAGPLGSSSPLGSWLRSGEAALARLAWLRGGPEAQPPSPLRRWKEMEAEAKKEYEDLAATDKQRYVDEMKAYKEKKRAEAAGDDDSDEEEEEAPASAGGAAADDASDDE